MTAANPPRPTPRPILTPAFILIGVWGAFLKLRADELGLPSAGPVFLTFSVVSQAVRLFGARLPQRLGMTRAVPSRSRLPAVRSPSRRRGAAPPVGTPGRP